MPPVRVAVTGDLPGEGGRDEGQDAGGVTADHPAPSRCALGAGVAEVGVGDIGPARLVLHAEGVPAGVHGLHGVVGCLPVPVGSRLATIGRGPARMTLQVTPLSTDAPPQRPRQQERDPDARSGITASRRPARRPGR